MANYYGTTVSEGGKISDAKAVREIIGKWAQIGSEGDITFEVNELGEYGADISVYGYDDFYIYKWAVDPENTGIGFEPGLAEIDYEDATEECLKELCPYIIEPLIIKSVGSEKCRYVGASAYIVSKDGVKFASLDNDIIRVMNSKTK